MLKTTFYILTIFSLCTCGYKENNSSSVIQDSTNYVTVKPEQGQHISEDERWCMISNGVPDLGIGLIIAPDTFQLYNDSLLLDTFASIDLYAYNKNHEIFLCPLSYKPDYGIMHFVCLGKSKKAYKVLVNSTEIKFFPRSKRYEFLSWKSYIFESSGVYSDRASLRETASDTANILQVPGPPDYFCPIEMKGDWLKVKYDCFEGDHKTDEPCQKYVKKCNDPLTGWLRWRRDNELLIGLYLLM